jgi:hypothetical protein
VRTSILLAAALSLASTGAARAASSDDSPPPGGIPDLVGARMLGLSAGIGAPAGNDGIYVNPGAIAARRRYSVELGGLFDRRGSENVDKFFGGSVVDSQSAPVTAGFSYQRALSDPYKGNLAHLALAGPVMERLFLGVSGKYISLSGPIPVGAGTMDAGLLWQVAEMISIGITGYNLIPISHPAVAPLGAGAGIALGSDTSFQVLADWRADFDRVEGKTANRYSLGAEWLVKSLLVLRGGWMHDEVLGTNWWSAGGGLVAQHGIALDVGYRQSLDTPSARTFAIALKFFVNP